MLAEDVPAVLRDRLGDEPPRHWWSCSTARSTNGSHK